MLRKQTAKYQSQYKNFHAKQICVLNKQLHEIGSPMAEIATLHQVSFFMAKNLIFVRSVGFHNAFPQFSTHSNGCQMFGESGSRTQGPEWKMLAACANFAPFSHLMLSSINTESLTTNFKSSVWQGWSGISTIQMIHSMNQWGQ